MESGINNNNNNNNNNNSNQIRCANLQMPMIAH